MPRKPLTNLTETVPTRRQQPSLGATQETQGATSRAPRALPPTWKELYHEVLVYAASAIVRSRGPPLQGAKSSNYLATTIYIGQESFALPGLYSHRPPHSPLFLKERPNYCGTKFREPPITELECWRAKPYPQRSRPSSRAA